LSSALLKPQYKLSIIGIIYLNNRLNPGFSICESRLSGAPQIIVNKAAVENENMFILLLSIFVYDPFKLFTKLEEP